jgi:hypothetical protein
MSEQAVHMTITWLTLLDWSEQITNTSLVDLIRTRFPAVWRSLNVGSVSRAEKKSKYKSSIDKHALLSDSWDQIEWYGGVSSKLDPASKWESYLSVTSNHTRELKICSSLNEFSLENLSLFIREASLLGNLGYGFGDESDQPGLIFNISGITYGIPKNDVEKQKADRFSRWFSERLSMGGLPPKKRYLHGMYRGAYQINVLNRSHVSIGPKGELSLSGMHHKFENLVSCENGTYIWSIPKRDLAEADAALIEACLVV